jgi:protein-S-isoprenylcysteine O-methyltransferase Ste14
VAGVGLAVAAGAVRDRGPGPLEAPADLVTTGMHARSRHPMYVGLTLVQLGLSGITRNAWMLASCPFSAGLLHRTVLREERWLRDRFGAAYEEYVARVPRYW